MFIPTGAYSNRSRGGVTFTFFIFILLLCSSALMYYYFMQTKALENELAKLREDQDAKPTYYVSSDARPTASTDPEEITKNAASTESDNPSADTIPDPGSTVSAIPETTGGTETTELSQPLTAIPDNTIPNEAVEEINIETTPVPTSTPRPTTVVKTPVTSLYDVAPVQATPKVRVRAPQRNTSENQ